MAPYSSKLPLFYSMLGTAKIFFKNKMYQPKQEEKNISFHKIQSASTLNVLKILAHSNKRIKDVMLKYNYAN